MTASIMLTITMVSLLLFVTMGLLYFRLIVERREVKNRDILLNTVNEVASLLLSSKTNQFTRDMNFCMGLIASAVKVDRVYVWKNVTIDNQLCHTQVYEWSEGAKPMQGHESTINMPYDNVPGWKEKLSCGYCINGIVRDMTPKEQEIFVPHDIISILIVPVFVDDQFWGFVGYDDCHKERHFSINEEAILRSGSLLIAHALVRNEMTENLWDSTAQMEQALDEARSANEAKSNFLATMSHEIRTPMNSIIGIAEIHLQDGNLNPDMNEAFNKIYESGDMLLKIINDILDISKIEAGKLELNPIKYDVPSLINDTAQLNCLRYESKPILFTINADENTPNDLIGDELRIKQILNNILSNAFKYTDEGKVDFSVTSERKIVNNELGDEVMIVFCVKDTGQGMTQDQIGKLFNEFTRFNIENNRTTVGTGLGLSITKRLVDLMNGSIIVESELGRGTSITVYIPQKRIGTDVCGPEIAEKLRNFRFESAAFKKKMQFSREYMPYGNVLVVDDVVSNIYVTKGMLKPYGLNIDTVFSGFEAIDKIKNGNKYDIVFMDHMMPRMDGIEATKIIRGMGYTKTIIALTANALIGREHMFLQNGFDGFISKPIDSRELNLVLIEFIKNKKPPEIIEAAKQERAKHLTNEDANFVCASKESSSEMEKCFVQDAEEAINVLEKLGESYAEYNEEEKKLYTTTVHGMKSVLANLGKKDLSAIAAILELAGEENNTALMQRETAFFKLSLKIMIEEFKKKKESKEEIENISDEDIVYLNEKIQLIKQACANIDKNAVKEVLDSLKQKKWTSRINKVLDEISLHILHSAFKKAIAVAELFLNPN
ncbi:MAG: ATP-binding protein [Treponema sp.]|nr:ATP-binding protein [Treponema sp.]MCL2250885.1 ATP-binding protein [Treponema sp.]